MIVQTIDKVNGVSSEDDSKKSSPSTPIHIKLNAMEDAQLTFLAERLGVSRSWVIQECVRKVIEKYGSVLTNNK